MKLKKFSVLFLALVLLVCAMAVPASADDPAAGVGIVFTDVPDGHWAGESIYRWVDAGIINGNTNSSGDLVFRMDDPMKRGEFAKVMSVVLGLEEEAENNFNDLSNDAWYAPYILRCNAAGIMKGDTNGNCNPEANISRQEAFAMFARTLNMTAGTADDLASFADAADFAEWAIPEAAAVVNYKGVKGNDLNQIKPTANISRAEVVKILDRLLAVYVDANGCVSCTSNSEAANAGNFIVVNGAYGDFFYAEADASGVLYVSAEDYGTSIKPANGMTAQIVMLNGTTKLANDSYYYNPGTNATWSRYIPLSYSYSYKSGDYGYADKTEYVYDEDWNLLEKKLYEDGELIRTETAEADDEGNVLKIFYDNVVAYEYSYDDIGRRIENKYYDEGELYLTTTYEYGEDNNLNKRTTVYAYGDVEYIVYTYDENGYETESKTYRNDKLQHHSVYERNENGRTIKETDSRYDTTTGKIQSTYVYEYNEETGYQDKYTYTGYDTDGNIYRQNVTTYVRNEKGRTLKQITVDKDGNEIDRYEYTYDDSDRYERVDYYSNGELYTYSLYTYKEENDTTIRTEYYADGTVCSVETDYIIENEDGSYNSYYEHKGDYSENTSESHYKYVEVPYGTVLISW